MANVKTMRENVKASYIKAMIDQLLADGEDVGMSGSNEFNFPVTLEDGTEDFVVVKVSIPTGSRDGDPYDGYTVRDEYQMKLKEKEEKAVKAAEAKQRKIEQDKKRREKLAESKALHGKA